MGVGDIKVSVSGAYAATLSWDEAALLAEITVDYRIDNEQARGDRDLSSLQRGTAAVFFGTLNLDTSGINSRGLIRCALTGSEVR